MKYAADILLWFAVFFYLTVTGAVLPLYLPGYEMLGTERGQFWIKLLLISGKALLVPIAVYVLYLIVSFIRDGVLKKPVLYPADIPAVLFLISVTVSYALSDEKQIALYGERGWYIGLIAYLSVGIGVLVIPRLGRAKNPFLPIIMAASFIVCVIGIIQDFAGNVFGFDGWSADKVSTIGNANWFAGYLMTVMFTGVSAYFLTRKRNRSKKGRTETILTVYLLVVFYMMIAQGSASAYLALWAVLLALMIISGRNPGVLQRVLGLMLLCAVSNLIHAIYVAFGGVSRPNDPIGRFIEKPVVAVLLLILTAVVYAGTGYFARKGKEIKVNIGIILTVMTLCAALVFTLLLIANTGSGVGYLGKEGSLFWFDYHWGSSRGATLSIGMEVFKGMSPFEMLFGKGPDTFYSFLTSGRFPETLAKCNEYFGGARLTNTHCELLTMLINTGIAGTVSFYGLMICVMIKGFRKKKVTSLACSLCILAYIINNIFSFQTAVNVSQLALVLGFGAWAVIPDKSEDR
ncbi:MAG: hypothetical protein J6X94_03175 [Lachnospiraceae bacterium]|nr:hypothetical protein [Lachnospiraceae bacterium]